MGSLAVPIVDTPLQRFAALGDLDAATTEALASAMRRRRPVRPRHELMIEGQPVGEPVIIVAGWAAATRQLADGRRQVIELLLPGDVVGMCDHEEPRTVATVIAVTPMTVCPAPLATPDTPLERVYALTRAIQDAQRVAQITRLGRLNAFERLADLILELHERLRLSGLAIGNRFVVPLTQEMLADALGLTPVHINRTLQAIRAEGHIVWKGQDVTIIDPARLARRIGRVAPAVSGTMI